MLGVLSIIKSKRQYFDTIIIGGGFAGLSTAYELLKHGGMSLIIEKEAFPGGMASCYKIENFWIEKFYHHFFTHDSEIVSLARELGNEDDLIWNKCRMGFFSNNKLYGFTTPLDLLKFSEVGFIKKIKFGLFTLFAKRNADYDGLDSLSAEEWLNKNIGPSTYKKIIAPLIKSKFGLHMADISAAFLMGRFEARLRSRDKLGREIFGYYKGGIQNFVSALYKRLLALGCPIRLNTEVKDIIIKENFNFEIKTSRNESIECKKIIVTIPVPIMNRLIKSHPDVRSTISRFNCMSAVCLCAGIKKKLSDYYWINIASDKIPFGVVVEHTNLISPSFYNGTHIVYLSGYYDIPSPLFKMKDEEIFDYYMGGLKRIFPEFENNEIFWWRVSREPFASPVFTKNYGKLLFELKSKLPRGFYLAGNILTYPNSRNINNVVKSGKKTASDIISDDGAS